MDILAVKISDHVIKFIHCVDNFGCAGLLKAFFCAITPGYANGGDMVERGAVNVVECVANHNSVFRIAGLF